MCIICDHYKEGSLSLKEAWLNLGEMYDNLDDDHRTKILNKLMDDAMYSEKEIDSDLWHIIFQGVLQQSTIGK